MQNTQSNVCKCVPQHEYDFRKVVTPSKVPTRLVALRYAHSAKLALSISTFIYILRSCKVQMFRTFQLLYKFCFMCCLLQNKIMFSSHTNIYNIFKSFNILTYR